MLGVLCARPRHWLLTSLSQFHHRTVVAAPFDRLICKSLPHPILSGGGGDRRNYSDCSAAASIWHAILPFGWQQGRRLFSRPEHEGEGSWNVGWDARPARWLHHPDSAWFLFGIAAVPLIDSSPEISSEVVVSPDEIKADVVISEATDCSSNSNYRVTGVVADGRCLFRAIAHMACLRNGEEAPGENRQRELADELRAQVVEELLKRQIEVERFIEDDFDVYVERIKKPYVWGGEPELLMSSHVLRTPISVFMKERTSGSLIKIADYGEEYQKDEENHINVLFYGYGHYDILEMEPIRDSTQKVSA